MDVLVTGASGFIGQRLVARLAARGDRVVGASHEEVDVPGAAECFRIDLLEPASLEAVRSAFKPDRIVHLAGLSHVGRSWQEPGRYFQVNVLGTENLLAVFAGLPILLASSAEVYGGVAEEEQPLAESRLPAPTSPYAMTKAAAERLTLAAGGTIMRLFTVIGPGQSPAFALPSFALQLAERRSGRVGPLKVGNLEARRDILHVEDAVDGITLLLDTRQLVDVCNIGGGEVVSIREALDRLIELAGVDVEVEVDSARVRPIDLPLLSADSGRLRSLGWSPRRSLDDALVEIWESALA